MAFMRHSESAIWIVSQYLCTIVHAPIHIVSMPIIAGKCGFRIPCINLHVGYVVRVVKQKWVVALPMYQVFVGLQRSTLNRQCLAIRVIYYGYLFEFFYVSVCLVLNENEAGMVIKCLHSTHCSSAQVRSPSGVDEKNPLTINVDYSSSTFLRS